MNYKQGDVKWGVVVAALILLLSGCLASCSGDTQVIYDNAIQLPFLKEAMRDSAPIYQFDTWEVSTEKPQGEPILVLEPQELLILEFYADGKVLVSNGYAQLGTKGSICYTISQDTLDAICQYHEE